MALLAVGTVAIFFRVGTFEFVNFDDYAYITLNPMVQSGLTWPGVVWAFRQFSREWTYWHPLSWLSHMLDCQLFGLSPAGPHVMNLFFHTLNTVLLFVLLRRTTGARGASAVVAALFAIHPIQVDSVAWVAERKNLLSTTFGLLTLLAYVGYTARPKWTRYLLVFVLMALGLMAKPMLVTLPFVMLLLDLWPLQRWVPTNNTSNPLPAEAGTPNERVGWTRLLVEKIPFFALSVASSLITILGHRATATLADVHQLPVTLRVANAVVAYAIYLRKLIWPVDLSILYVHPGRWPVEIVISSALILLGVLVWGLLQMRQRPYLLVGWLWFLGVLVPTIGLVQAGGQVEADVQSVADRFVYLPVIGLFAMVVWTVASWTESLLQPRVVQITLAAVALAACAWMTSLQLRYWRNSVTLLERAVKIAPSNSVAHVMLGNAFFERGQLDPALREYKEALRLRRDDASAWVRAGVVLTQQGKASEALRYFQSAVQLSPGWPEPRRQAALALLRLGRNDQARAVYQTLPALLPNTAEGHRDLADMFSEGGQFADAIEHYREALRLKSDLQPVLNNLAWLRSTCPQPELRDGREAVALAERACELSHYRNADFVGTLAAAYAETGRFGDAITTVQKAEQLATPSGSTNLLALLQQMKQQFHAGKPYHKNQQ